MFRESRLHEVDLVCGALSPVVRPLHSAVDEVDAHSARVVHLAVEVSDKMIRESEHNFGPRDLLYTVGHPLSHNVL